MDVPVLLDVLAVRDLRGGLQVVVGAAIIRDFVLGHVRESSSFDGEAVPDVTLRGGGEPPHGDAVALPQRRVLRYHRHGGQGRERDPGGLRRGQYLQFDPVIKDSTKMCVEKLKSVEIRCGANTCEPLTFIPDVLK